MLCTMGVTVLVLKNRGNRVLRYDNPYLHVFRVSADRYINTIREDDYGSLRDTRCFSAF
jgi:hypothetical protein